MKKLITVSTFIIIVVIYTAMVYAGSNTRLFFDGKVYDMEGNIMSHNDEYFVDAAKVADILDINYSISMQNPSVTCEYKGTTYTSEIEVYNGWNSIPEKYIHTKPEFINNRLFIPFGCITRTLGMKLDYDRNKGILYVLPDKKIDSSVFSEFINPSYGYSVPISDEVYLNPNSRDGKFNATIVSLEDKYGLFNATVSCDRMDDSTTALIRKYTGNPSMTEEEVFDKFSSYKKDYFALMEDFYKKGFLYGGADGNPGEYNIKTYKEYDEKVFGQDSHIILYNTITPAKQDSNEITHLDISIPVFKNKTIYSVNFTLDKNYVNEMTFRRMSELLNSIKIVDTPQQTDPVKVFTDKSSLNQAYQGIYGDPDKSANIYDEYINRASGYKTSLPSSFTPYIQNNIVNSFDYRSFKVDYNSFFSISVEPALAGSSSIINKINYIKYSNGSKINITTENSIKLPGKEVEFLEYELSGSSETTYIRDYFILHGSRLYNIQLNSRSSRPNLSLQNEIARTVLMFDFLQPSKDTEVETPSAIRFTNVSGGYTLLYPEDWQLHRNSSEKTGYLRLALRNSDLSGPLDILINEGELNTELSYSGIPKFAALQNISGLDSYFVNYSAPYMGKTGRLLFVSYVYKKNASYIYKLVDYLDDNEKSRLCYSVDIVSEKKVYSLFISLSKYATADGRFNDEGVNKALTLIGSSFDLDQ